MTELINEVILRLQKRSRDCWEEPSPYISVNEEWLEIKIKVDELENIKLKS